MYVCVCKVLHYYNFLELVASNVNIPAANIQGMFLLCTYICVCVHIAKLCFIWHDCCMYVAKMIKLKDDCH